MIHHPPIYRSFLLRLWQSGGAPSNFNRASLEDPRTHQVISFASLEDLWEYLHSVRSTASGDPAAGNSSAWEKPA
jgi:hypothetical protein